MNTVSPRSMAARRRSTAGRRPIIRYGECRSPSVGLRNLPACCAFWTPRAASRRASETGRPISTASRCTCCESALRSTQRTSAFVVLINVVDGHAAEVFHQVQQVLIVLVPFGGNLVEEDDTLIRPAKLDEAGLADVLAQRARFFHVVVAGKVDVLKPLHQVVELVALEHFLVHGEKRRPRVLGQLDVVLPAIR